jgi:Cu/Ag efflux protein CusF
LKKSLIKKRSLVVVIALSLAAISAACKQKAAPENGNNQGAEKLYSGVGVVEAVDREMATVQINHEDIEDFMPAMSMPFRVKDKALLDAASPGDRVEFSIQDTSDGMFLAAIKKL